MTEPQRLRHDLPREVFELAARLGVTPGAGASAVRLRQAGRLRQDAAARWTAYTASQVICTARCGFDWRARIGPVGCVRVQDALIEGEGRLKVSFLGAIPLGGARPSAEVTRGELIRYLAELAWAPEAILRNRSLQWAVDSDGAFTVSVGDGRAAATVALVLDRDGRIAEVLAHDRPRAVAGGFQPTPWRGRFADYRPLDGVWTPATGAVGWIVGGCEEVVWEGHILERRAAP